jgi:hypothetical protein
MPYDILREINKLNKPFPANYVQSIFLSLIIYNMQLGNLVRADGNNRKTPTK